MRLSFSHDDGSVRKIMELVLSKFRKHFKDILDSGARIMTAYFELEGDPGDRIPAGQTFLVDRRTRDLFEVDFIISVNRDLWNRMSKQEKMKLMFHELMHVGVKQRKDGTYRFFIRPHDLEISRFKDELELFPLSKEEEDIADFFATLLAKNLDNIIEKSGLPIKKLKRKKKKKKGGQ